MAPRFPLADLRSFLDASPSPYHAARSAVDRIESAGFAELELGADWGELPGAGYVVDGGSVIAWRSPAGASPTMPFRLAGAHTDSPCLRALRLLSLADAHYDRGQAISFAREDATPGNAKDHYLAAERSYAEAAKLLRELAASRG